MRLTQVDKRILQILKPNFFYVECSKGVLETFRITNDKVGFWDTYNEYWEYFNTLHNFNEGGYLKDKRVFLLSGGNAL